MYNPRRLADASAPFTDPLVDDEDEEEEEEYDDEEVLSGTPVRGIIGPLVLPSACTAQALSRI